MRAKVFLCALVCACAVFPAFSQGLNRGAGIGDEATVSVGRTRPIMEGFTGALPHPYHVEQRRWTPIDGVAPEVHQSWLKRQIGHLLHKTSNVCDSARQRYVSFGELPAPGSLDEFYGCGRELLEYDGENLATSAGVDANSSQMANTAAQAASCNYVALTNTAITPAVADTTLSGEISSNGLSRAQGTYANASAALGTPPTPGSLAIVGSTGSVTHHYWVFSCTFQGCTAVGSSATIATGPTTLTTANYVTGSFTGQLGAAYYVVVDTFASASAPSGANAGGASATGAIAGYISCGSLVAGTAPTCNFAHTSNTTTSFTVPASDQTYAGKLTVTKTFTATGTQSAQAFGIFNAASVGTLCWEGTFTSASLVNNDTLSFTETVFH